ncbi:hypothetical protein Tco_0319177, partial [Tanacetum coccineum]
MPESSQQHIKIERICFDCGNLLHGLNCLECGHDQRKIIGEKLFKPVQNTSKSSNDNSNFLPADRSDLYHEEFTDELAHIISPRKSEPSVSMCLNVLPTLELDFIPSSESIFAYVVWIFLPFLFIPVIPPYLLSCGDEDTIFDPGISKDCPDCEDSQFCHSSRVSHPQL